MFERSRSQALTHARCFSRAGPKGKKAKNYAQPQPRLGASPGQMTTTTRPKSSFEHRNELDWQSQISNWIREPPWLQSPPRGRHASSILTGACAFYLIIHTVASIRSANGASMLPTLNVWSERGGFDRILLSYLHRRGRGIQVGDIVSFSHPVRRGNCVIKRVVGMPGDFVLRDTPGLGDGTVVQVPEGHCWVAGDNLDWSRDSRHFGPLPLALIRGKAIARVMPEPKWLVGGLKPIEEPSGYV